MTISRRQFLRRSAIAVAAANRGQISGAVTSSILKGPARISTTLKQLGSIFSGLRANFELGVTKCWLDDEWARGAWAFVGFTDFLTASAPEGRIHFAGEQLSPWFSWIQGAVSSGLKAVKEIDEAAKV